jgi:DNA adenine methylase
VEVKKSQAKEIVQYFPNEIKTYYEPFLGSASVLFELLHSTKKVEREVNSIKNRTLKISFF